jgi:hypothetical protein
MEELISTESLDILFPASLPEGYAFTDFEVIDVGTRFIVRAFAVDPYILFTIRVGTDNQIENYSHEVRGMSLSIIEMDDGSYQAEWHYNDNYYTMVVSDEVTLLEIINNLTGA